MSSIKKGPQKCGASLEEMFCLVLRHLLLTRGAGGGGVICISHRLMLKEEIPPQQARCLFENHRKWEVRQLLLLKTFLFLKLYYIFT